MKASETIASARRLGPLLAIDADGNAITGEDFAGAGELEQQIDGGAFGASSGTLGEIGHGYYYLESPSVDAFTAKQWIAAKLAGVCEEFVFRESIERSPNGIAVGETDASKRRIGPLLALDADGNKLDEAALAGVTVEVTANGSTWAAAGGGIVIHDDGYPYYVATLAEVSGGRGWIAVKLSGGCEEFTLREDLVGGPDSGGVPFPSGGSEASTIEQGLGDLALTWSNDTADADLSLLLDVAGVTTDVAGDRGLVTAVILSLFTDRRAETDDKPPSGDPLDRRGSWDDQFAVVAGDRRGSRLWLLDRSKLDNQAGLRAEEYVREALAWMIEDRVVSSIDVGVEVVKSLGLMITVGLQRPGRDPVSFRFAHAWEHMQGAI